MTIWQALLCLTAYIALLVVMICVFVVGARADERYLTGDRVSEHDYVKRVPGQWPK